MSTAIILGQGITGSTLAWRMHWRGNRVYLIDRGEPVTASRIAAGLITPFTGKNMIKSADFEESQLEAERFYGKVEETLGVQLLERKPSIRLLTNDKERERYHTTIATRFADEAELRGSTVDVAESFVMRNARRLRVGEYLDRTREFFRSRGQYHQAEVNVAEDIKVDASGVTVRQPGIRGDVLCFCQGYQAAINPWFPGIPDAPARGEILRVRIPGRIETAVVHHKYWLAPAFEAAIPVSHVTEAVTDLLPVANAASMAPPDDRTEEFLLGATYDRDDLLSGVTQEGRMELLNGLRHITAAPATVVGHQSAVRASTRRRRPVVAIHDTWNRLAMINGMGSKASLMAPAATNELLQLLTGTKSTSEPKAQGRSLTELAHRIARRVIRPGDRVIDATAGNGHDTVFLANTTGERGIVISIDCQQKATEATHARLIQQNIRNVQQLTEDHSKILKGMSERGEIARVIMFNLGYLPGSDKQLKTSAETTVEAVRAGLKLLDAGGVMTVIAYRGHTGGQEESRAVAQIGNHELTEAYDADVIYGSETNSASPVLFVFRRRKS